MQNHPSPEFLASQQLSPNFQERFWAKVNKDGPVPSHMPHLGQCWVWTAYIEKSGYGSICSSHGHAPIRAHVASWLIHFGAVPEHLCVLHSCDLKRCCRKDHLFLGTRIDNFDDMLDKGRARLNIRPRKEHRILTEKEVITILNLYHVQQLSQPKIALIMKVGTPHIGRIVRGERWGQISKQWI